MQKSYLSKMAFLILGLFLGVFMLILLIGYQVKNSKDLGFHEHADFAVFIEGERFDFSDFRYMSLEPCTVEEAQSLIPAAYAHGGGFDEEGLKEAVHLHNGNGGTIHVHRKGVTYEDFFESLGMEFHDTALKDADGNLFEVGQGKEFKFIVNGEKVDTLEAREIRDLDRALISYGNVGRSETQLMQEYGYVSNNACVYSESCPHRPATEPESCSQEAEPLLLKMIGL